ncbi:hypothetical protein L226DRAFT_163270 [Lentinus tigrinus ALCF2SS1-7]|uniref:Uncharacterized protein n=1 Tax=Lentinus tigrinus ALCF2SS1-6 TaxID=1328759 RepID=A0A5C2S2X9_9APHY|nr:hypothetical protein L227DRAFT_223886 [Lentinus tigrinus ALCF2SS1-6]RPD71834.1 hypothetical protein L226DRAFT_163270 [Lentinus tigrinus ALCF2SS1-7]
MHVRDAGLFSRMGGRREGALRIIAATGPAEETGSRKENHSPHGNKRTTKGSHRTRPIRYTRYACSLPHVHLAGRHPWTVAVHLRPRAAGGRAAAGWKPRDREAAGVHAKSRRVFRPRSSQFLDQNTRKNGGRMGLGNGGRGWGTRRIRTSLTEDPAGQVTAIDPR